MQISPERRDTAYAPAALEVHWAPPVSKEKIRRLYESDASGLRDDELLDDVGITLYLRCKSILTVT